MIDPDLIHRNVYDGIELDDQTAALLESMAIATGNAVRKLISSIVTEVVHDDAEAHGELTTGEHRQFLN